MKIRDTKIFSGAAMNLDDDPRLLRPNEHREIWNSILSVAEGSRVGCLQNIKGTTNVFTLPINAGLGVPDNLVAIGCCEDIKENALIVFLCDTVNNVDHSILRVYLKDYRCEWILKEQPILNFKAAYKISSAFRIGDLLYWTDGYEGTAFVDYNPPRKINIEKAKAFTAYSGDTATISRVMDASTVDAYYTGRIVYVLSGANPFAVNDIIVAWVTDGDFRDQNYSGDSTVLKVGVTGGSNYIITDRSWPSLVSVTGENVSGTIIEYADERYYGIDFQTIDRIKYPPVLAPSAEYDTDTNFLTNNLRNSLYQFAYRYVYDDNEKSVFSPISDVPLCTSTEYPNGDYYEYNSDNVIKVIVNTGIDTVRKVEIAVREGNSGLWKLAKSVDKYDEDGDKLLKDSVNYEYSFYNNEVLSTLDQADTARLYDFVPQISENEDIIENNRIADANYTEGFDNINTDVSLTAKARDVISEEITGVYDFEQTSYPLVGSTEAPMYGRAIRWTYGTYPNPPPAGKYISPQQYGCVVCNFANIPIKSGYVYTLKIETSLAYTPASDPGVMPWPADNVSDTILAQATVTGSTLEQMLNEICNQLRSDPANSGYSVIGFVKEAYGSYNNHIWGQWTSQVAGYTLANTSELGFVVSYGGTSSIDWSSITVSIRISNVSYKYESLKSGANHQFGIIYYDRALRSGAVNKIDSVFVPFQYDGTDHQIRSNYIEWEISHRPPMFAKYYKFAYAGNTSLSYWVQCPLISIAEEDDLDDYVGDYLGLEIAGNFYTTEKSLSKFNVPGYIWQRGDRVRFLSKADISGTVPMFYQFPDYLDFEILGVSHPMDKDTSDIYQKDELGAYILDADGNKIEDTAPRRLIIKRFNYKNLGIETSRLALEQVIIEIYRPKKGSESPLYYEIGREYNVLNPHTSNRMHQGGQDTDAVSVLWQRDQTALLSARGIIWKGDCYITPRYMINPSFGIVFPCESMSYSDFYTSNSFSIGRPNMENDNMRRQQYEANIIWSGKYIENTKVNELSRVMASDYISLSEKFGPINFVKEVGFTLKVVQKYKPSSIYVGRQGLAQADVSRGEVLFASDNTLGTVTVSESSYGTEHPLSCIKHERNLYWYDINSGAIVRDSPNGVRSISQPEDGDAQTSYKIKSFLQGKSKTFQQNGVDVYSAYDGRYDIVYFAFVDKTDASESFTIGFHEPSNTWISFYSFIPDFLFGMKMNTVSWKNGVLWAHNEGTRMNFYGTQYGQWLTTISNKEPLVKKRYMSIREQSNKVFDLRNYGDVWIDADENYTRGQGSLIKSGTFRAVEGGLYAPFGKNMITHQLLPANDDYVNGDDMRGDYIELTLHNDSTDETNLFSIDVDAVPSPS